MSTLWVSKLCVSRLLARQLMKVQVVCVCECVVGE